MTIETGPLALETRLAAIEARNRRVEVDKAWERSITRRAAVAVLTYVSALLFLVVIDADRPLLGAAVPAVGFLLSTLGLPWVRRTWQRRATAAR